MRAPPTAPKADGVGPVIGAEGAVAARLRRMDGVEDPACADDDGVVSTSMDRLCERPGCSDVASVAYGMRPEDLVFWLDRLDAAALDGGGVLCRRHADSMVVPRSWTLDDLRDPDLHLFRPPAASETSRPRRRSSAARGADDVEAEQLALGVEAPDDTDSDDSDSDDPARQIDQVDQAQRAGAADVVDGMAPEESSDHWSPNFDAGDDLGGLLSARSPLLARAFRGDDRPRT